MAQAKFGAGNMLCDTFNELLLLSFAHLQLLMEILQERVLSVWVHGLDNGFPVLMLVGLWSFLEIFLLQHMIITTISGI